MISFMRTVIDDISDSLRSKLFYSASFFTLWTLFLLYNNNFFSPFYFWMVYSVLVLFVIPVYFLIALEEGKLPVRIAFAALLLLAVFFAFFLINLKGSKRNIEKNEIINLLAIASFIPVFLYMLLKRKFFLSDYGFSAGRVREALVVTAVCSACAVLIAFFASHNPQFKNTYPLIRAMKGGGWIFFKYELGFLLFFFLWEFYFRGIMLFSFAKFSPSVPSAVLLQAVIFAFAHLGKPGLETVSSLFGGILLGFLAYRLSTFAPAAIMHFALAFTMDVISVFFR